MKSIQLLAGTAALAAFATNASAHIEFNELYVSHAGTDVGEFIELSGPANAALTNVVICTVDSDAGTQLGILDRAYDLSAFSLDANGRFVLGCPTVVPAPGLALNAQDNLENSTTTFYVLEASSAANVAAVIALLGTNVSNGPTTTLLGSFGTIEDNVTIADSGISTGDVAFDGAPVFGPDGSNLPAGIVRCGDAPFGWSAQFLDFQYPLYGTAGFTTPSPSAANPNCGATGVSGVAFCYGDGSGTACPCGNSSPVGNNEGCLNSLGTGALLVGTGNPSISGDTFVLGGTGMPSSSALYFQGTTQQSAGAGAAFGDGLRCAGGTIIRLGTTTNVAGASQYPFAGAQLVSIKGACAVGDVRTYQIWYRNAAAFCTVATFNLSNGWTATWVN